MAPVACSMTSRCPTSVQAWPPTASSTTRSKHAGASGWGRSSRSVRRTSSSMLRLSVANRSRTPDGMRTMPSMNRSGICGRVHSGSRRGEIPASLRSKPSAPTISTGPPSRGTVVATSGPEAPTDDLLHDLGGAAVDRGDAGVDVRAGDRILEHVAVAAVQLHARVDHPLLQLGAPPLGLRRLLGAELALVE